MRAVPMTVLLISLAGCMSYGGNEHAQTLSENGYDDDYCTAHGLHYPDTGYVTCRWSLQNDRLYRQWRGTQMAHLASSGTPGQSGDTAGIGYRPLDRARFQCRLEPQFGRNYVFCGEATLGR